MLLTPLTRLGGDEFAVLLEDFDASSGHHFAAHLGAVLRAPHLLGDQRVVIHASIGIALGDTTTNAQDLLRHADRAMYQAKTHNRNRLRAHR